MTDISDLTALVTARFLAASASADEFFSALDRALASFGVAIAAAAIGRCMQAGTPQGEAVGSYIVDVIMAARKAGAPMPKLDSCIDPTPPPPKPQLASSMQAGHEALLPAHPHAMRRLWARLHYCWRMVHGD